MSEWADHSHELSRKALEKLSDAVSLYELGNISARELWLVCDALYDVVSGLVNWDDCANVIYAVRQFVTPEKEAT